MSEFVIAGFSKMSKQRIFNMAVAHIAKTRQKSMTETGGCCYRGSGCNAAPLIKPEMREKADAMGNWRHLSDEGMVPSNNLLFIMKLQNAHDFTDDDSFMTDWKNNMAQLAATFNLSTATLDKVVV